MAFLASSSFSLSLISLIFLFFSDASMRTWLIFSSFFFSYSRCILFLFSSSWILSSRSLIYLSALYIFSFSTDREFSEFFLTLLISSFMYSSSSLILLSLVEIFFLSSSSTDFNLDYFLVISSLRTYCSASNDAFYLFSFSTSLSTVFLKLERSFTSWDLLGVRLLNSVRFLS